jgi:alkylated DNA repair dioxygenase AlkB
MKAHKNIKGLYYVKDIISKNKSDEIFQKIDSYLWCIVDKNDDTKVPIKDKKRLVQQYGYNFDYTTYDIVSSAPEMPCIIKELRDMLTKLCKELQLIDDTYEFNQCIINNYSSGEGISAHIDIMSLDARYNWTHEIKHKAFDKINNKVIFRGRRISCTFRSVKI